MSRILYVTRKYILDGNLYARYDAPKLENFFLEREGPMIRFRLKEVIADQEFRTGKRTTLGSIADATGIKQPTLSRIAGTRGYNTTTDNIDKLCRYFGCKVSDLLEYVPDEELGE
jgi:DNA-binding Xre family transcriptional regulator